MTPRARSLDRRIFVDTSAHYALFDANDDNHEAAARILADLLRDRWRLFTTNFVLAETHALALRRLDWAAALDLLTELTRSPGLTIVRVSPADERRAQDIIAQYRDKLFSNTDATSFAVMERLGLGHAFSFDRDFAQYGFVVHSPPGTSRG